MSGRHRWRNDEHGYGIVTRTLHWVIVVLIATQFVVGYLLESGSGRGRGRGRGRSGESGRGRGRGRGGDDDLFGDDTLLTVHVVLGVTILAVAAVRLVWRWTTPLPPWAPTLSAGERRLAHWTERVLYLSMFAIPITGIWLVTSHDDDLVIAHVTAHIVFFVALTCHLGLIVKHQVVDRDRLVRRML